MKELIFLSVAPDNLCYSWQYEVFIENVRRLGYLNEIRILIFLPKDRISKGWNPIWDKLEERYKNQNVKIFRYIDEDDINLFGVSQAIEYSQLCRPYVLKKHFEQNPELKNKAIFYHDSDIVFTKYMDFSKFLQDDIQYMSNTAGYMNVPNFFESTGMYNRALPEKREELKNSNFVDTLARMNGVSRDILIQNGNSTGGAQYILKNIDSKFWEDVYNSCIIIRNFLSFKTNGINRKYFKDEDAGYQSWCADMWAVLWSLWKRGDVTSTPQELDFAWATDTVSKWDRVNIYHDAGGSAKNLFNKNSLRYKHDIATPFLDDFSYVSEHMCSKKYTEEIEKVGVKYYNRSAKEEVKEVAPIIESTSPVVHNISPTGSKPQVTNIVNRWDVINKFITERGYKSYLEIGYYKGWSFDNVKCHKKTAVDPFPSKTQEQENIPYGKSVLHIKNNKADKIVKMTSDEYFSKNSEKYDIIFIDGLHEYKQVQKDIINSLKYLNEGGVIILHDCNPPTERHTLDGVDGCWNGDVYKTIMAFKIINPNVYTIDTDWGIGIIEKFDMPENIDIINELEWSDFENNRKESIGLISVEEFKNK